MGVRCSQTEKYRRLEQIETWLADGYARATILGLVRKEEWGIGSKAVDWYIEAIGRKWRDEYENEKPSALPNAIKKRERLYLRALKEGDTRTALAIMDSADKIKGLFTERLEFEGRVGAVPSVVMAIKKLRAENTDVSGGT